ncbi:excinuclease Cho [Pseudomonas sp. 5P_3.1_Bac2]|uniref:excinuclease Cho n=1 Tax=Pseudomonas sp. 5P_3.1_Bac2 TaxID=2971617 RepID=UPI0021CA94D7|nr:excinuclease Cho [Pseudomonas sp. 5P_3.1_Bac2]MCU1717393.1 excinuclease Cho [Pseudomonas sp. 5P_3.1_Bac2]
MSELTRLTRLQELYKYPEHLRLQVDQAPAVPGVYLLYGAQSKMPLYIGKSVNIRSRLLSHLRTVEEARLLRQTEHIEYIPTAGEIGALLLESKLIKQRQPLFNKRLRKSRRLCSLRLQDGRVQIVSTTHLTGDETLYGLFRNQVSAHSAVLQLADEHGLCMAVMGLEKYTGQGCFRAQIKKCRGACRGTESHAEHQARLLAALQDWQLYHWPYPGAIALHEARDGLEQFHVLNQWHYLGSYPDLAQAQAAAKQPAQAFDGDSYKILLRPILSPQTPVIALS